MHVPRTCIQNNQTIKTDQRTMCIKRLFVADRVAVYQN